MQQAAYGPRLDDYPIIRNIILNILSNAIQAKSNIGGVKFFIKESNENKILSEVSKEFASNLKNQLKALMRLKGNAEQFTKRLTQLKARANKVAKATDPEIKASDKLSYFKNAVKQIKKNIDSLNRQLKILDDAIKRLENEIGIFEYRIGELRRQIEDIDAFPYLDLAKLQKQLADQQAQLANKQAALEQIKKRKELINSQIKDLKEAKTTFERAIPPLEDAAETEAKAAAKPKPEEPEPKTKPDEIDIPKKSGKRIVGEALGHYYVGNLVCRVIGMGTVYMALALMTKNPTIRAIIKFVYENVQAVLIGASSISAIVAALLVKHKGNVFAAYSELFKRYGANVAGAAFGCASGFRAGLGQELQETTWDRTNATKEWNELQKRVVEATPRLGDDDFKAAEFFRSPQSGDIRKFVKQGKYWDATKSGFKQLVGAPVVNFVQYMGGIFNELGIQGINELFSDIYDVKNYEGTIAEQIKTATYVENIIYTGIKKMSLSAYDAFFGDEKTIAEEMVEKYANLKTLERFFNELVRRTIPQQTIKGFSNLIVFFESQGVPKKSIMHLIDCLFTKEFAESIEQYKKTREAIKKAYGFDLPPAEISAIIEKLIKAKNELTETAFYKELKAGDPRKLALDELLAYIPDVPKADCEKLMKANQDKLIIIYEVLFPKSKNKPKPQPAPARLPAAATPTDAPAPARSPAAAPPTDAPTPTKLPTGVTPLDVDGKL
jgi:prefoldin subunit 5